MFQQAIASVFVLGLMLLGAAPANAQAMLNAAGHVIGKPATPGAVNPASLTSVSGLTDWWDASALTDATVTPTVTNMLSATGTPVTSWDSPVGSIISKGSGSHAMTVAGTGQVNWPKLDGTSGGVGNPNNYLRYVAWHWPVMYPDNSLTVSPGANFGTGFGWSVMLVWSRPNTRQAATGQTIGGTGLTGAVTLLSVGGIPVLRMGGAGLGADTLNLLPTGANVSLGTMTRRHSHSLILTSAAGGGITAILDGTQVATGVSGAALGASNTGTMLFMAESGATNGSAQLWFHEAAVWDHALSAPDLTKVDGILAGRYPMRGNRVGIALLGNGQSNAAFMYSTANATPLIDAGLAYQLGVLAVTLLNDDQAHNSTSFQLVSSTGIADRADGGGYLNNTDAPGPTFNPTSWPPGGPDVAIQANINGLSAGDQADIAGIFWNWGENDAANWFYGDKTTYTAIVKRQLVVERSYVTAVQPSANAANLPALIMAVPYGAFNNGAPMLHEVFTDLTTDGVSNFQTYFQTYDTFSRTDSGYVPATGQWTDDLSNAAHRGDADDQKLAQRVVPALAQMLMADGRCEHYCSFPTSPHVMTGQGPTITNVARDVTNPALLHLTIAHDGGTDLIVSQGAAFCHGFSVSKGVPSNNTQLFCNNWATGGAIGSTTRIDATHLDVMFPSSTATYTTLYYPYPSLETASHMVIGPGNAVTDNWASVAPVGWNPAEIGWAGQNFPLQMPGYGLTIH